MVLKSSKLPEISITPAFYVLNNPVFGVILTVGILLCLSNSLSLESVCLSSCDFVFFFVTDVIECLVDITYMNSL